MEEKLIVPFIDIQEKLNPFLVKRITPKPETVEVKELDAMQLMLNSNRFDVLLKYLFLSIKEQKLEIEWFNKLYKEQINILSGGSYAEGDGTKNNIEDFIVSFEKLINNVKKNGFDSNISILPINNNNIPIDGAHRLAAAALCQQKITTVKLPLNTLPYNYSLFLDNKFPVEYADRAAIEYCKLNPKAHLVHIFPAAKGKDQKVEEILNKHFKVFYKKSFHVHNYGPYYICRHLYEKEPWLGDISDGYRGAWGKAKNCFNNSLTPLRVYVVQAASLAKTVEAKEEIRQLYNIGKHAVHINDTHEETVMLSKLFFNTNSLDFLNHAKPKKYNIFEKQFQYFREWIATQNLDGDRFCVDGSSALSVFGLREGRDIDFLHHGYDEKLTTIENKDVGSHNVHAKEYYAWDKDEIIYNPQLHFYFFGIKFITLDVLKQMKSKRGEQKDFYDVKLINNYKQKGLKYLTVQLYSKLDRKYTNLKSRMKRLPSKIFKKLNEYKFNFLESIGKETQKTSFEGFDLYYSKKTSIVMRYKKEGSYEPDVIKAIVDVLQPKTKPVMLDIGANIGMVSLAVLSQKKDVQIHAFEPGPHQHQYLTKNIEANGLQKQVTLYSNGLSHEVGEAQFSIHDSKDASGDGLIDTNRAGKTKQITIQISTLDVWWEAAGKIDVDYIKVDTEGAELWILEGGKKLIESQRPVFLLEIFLENLKNYPYEAEDILAFFEERAYSLKTIDGIVMTTENIKTLPQTISNYIAQPN